MLHWHCQQSSHVSKGAADMGRRCWSTVLEQEELCPEARVCEGCVTAGCVLGERAGVAARVALGEASSRAQRETAAGGIRAAAIAARVGTSFPWAAYHDRASCSALSLRGERDKNLLWMFVILSLTLAF